MSAFFQAAKACLYVLVTDRGHGLAFLTDTSALCYSSIKAIKAQPKSAAVVNFLLKKQTA